MNTTCMSCSASAVVSKFCSCQLLPNDTKSFMTIAVLPSQVEVVPLAAIAAAYAYVSRYVFYN